MPRPRSFRKIQLDPKAVYFKPQGIPMSFLEVVELTLEEAEAMRLRHEENLEQTEAAKKMDTSQSTYQRILTSAYKKVTEALVHGKAIKIIKE